MRKLIIKGGNPLEGKVKISGAKNAALPILAATILLNGESTLTNVPNLNDVITMIRMLCVLGMRVEYCDQNNTVNIWGGSKIKHVAPYELVTKMRASFFIIGPVLAREGLAKIPLPGGCAIGFRPVNYYIKGLEAMGAKIEMEHGFVVAKATKLKGANIYLDFPSVGATESLMMAASIADGETVLENVAKEPEIADLAKFLNRCGAKITGEGTEKIVINGVNSLRAADHKVMPDRIEAGTFMVAAAMSRGSVAVENIVPEHMTSIFTKLAEAGVDVRIEGTTAFVNCKERVKAVSFKTMPHPGFPTDMQAQFSAMLSLAEGTSVINETIFENRFMHVQELKRMGADIQIEGKTIIINGVNNLSGAPVRVPDLRAGAALVLAGLVAGGETLIEDSARLIDRGYERMIQKLTGLGADVKEVI